MRRSPVKVGAKCAAKCVATCATMCAVMFVSSFAYAQQPPTPQPAPSRQAAPPAPSPRQHAPAVEATSTTWTLFLVTVPFKGTWSITSVGSFNTKGIANADCLRAMASINRIPGVAETNSDAKKAEGSAEYMICLPATASQSRGGGGGGGGGQGGGGGE